jgi:hypothetical protein
MTEDEAKTKWCPFARIDPQQPGSWGNRPASHMGVHCIASACMAWRWGTPDWETYWTDNEFPGGNALQRVRPDGTGWEVVSKTAYETHRTEWRRRVRGENGYCGLAGQP